jgi:hypothetical protein
MPSTIVTALGLLLVATPAIATPPDLVTDPQATANQVPTVTALLEQARRTMASTRDYTGKLKRTERLGDELITQLNAFKFAKPFSVYLAFLEPIRHREVLYVRGWNKGNLCVHKGSFPDLTVNLDPQGSTAMANNHHPITHFGFDKLIDLAARNLLLAQKRAEGDIQVSDGGQLLGQPVWKIVAALPHGGSRVRVAEDETLWDIAERTGQDMYWILVNNRDQGWDEPDDIDPGDEVFVPRYYGARTDFYLNKETGLPVQVVVVDQKGRLYERYEYSDIRINPGLTRADFDPDNPKYKF